MAWNDKMTVNGRLSCAS